MNFLPYYSKHYFSLSHIRLCANIICGTTYKDLLDYHGFKLATPFEQICSLKQINHARIVATSQETPTKTVKEQYLRLCREIFRLQHRILAHHLDKVDQDNFLSTLSPDPRIIASELSDLKCIALTLNTDPLLVAMVKNPKELNSLNKTLQVCQSNGPFDLCVISTFKQSRLVSALRPSSETVCSLSTIPTIDSISQCRLYKRSISLTLMHF